MILYRGMSRAELRSAFITGQFESECRLNAGHAANLYCMTSDIDEARFYAKRCNGIVVEFEVPEFYQGFKDEGTWNTEFHVPVGYLTSSGKVFTLPISCFKGVIK